MLRQEIMGIEITDFSIIDVILKELEPLKTLWETTALWRHTKECVLTQPFISINKQTLQTTIMELEETIDLLQKDPFFKTDDFPSKLVLNYIIDDLTLFTKKTIPIILGMRNEYI